MLHGLLLSPCLYQVAPELRENMIGPQGPERAFLGDRQEGVAQVRLEQDARIEKHSVHDVPYSPLPSTGSLSKGTSDGRS